MNKVFRSRLLASSLLIGSAAFAAPAAAQVATPAEAQPGINANSNEPADSGEVIVTGSRIANPNLEQSSPVVSIGAEEITRQVPASAEELLRDLPGTAPGINAGVNNGSNGTATFNLRGLGSNRNLVLLNSRRVVPAGLNNVVDLNIIPIALIQRLDVFTGGAVTSYGADAISGVVNFITRQDFAGVDLSANFGITERGDGARKRFDLITGANFDDGKGNVTLALGYTKVNPVLQGARALGEISRQSTCSAALGQTPAPGPNCDNATVGANQGSQTAVPASLFFPLPTTGPFASGARFDPATGTIVPGFADYNFNPVNLYQTPLDRYSVYASGKYEVANNIEVYTEAFYSRNRVRQELAPTGTFTNSFFVPLNNQFLTAAQRTQLCSFAGIADCAAAVTAGTEVTAIVARRFVESGPRTATFLTNTFQVTAGVRGKLTGSLNFDIFAQHGETDRRTTNTGTALADRVQSALRNCPAGSAVGCVPINIFGAEGTLSQASLAFVGVPTSTFVNTEFTSAQGLINGDFGIASPLAENPIGIAVGVEYRKYTAAQFGDLPSRTPGQILGSGGAFNDIAGSYNSYEGFAEINAPLITNRAFFHDLTVEAGIRYADYSTTGSNTTWKVGGSWSPVRDFKLRGAYSRAVRAPNIGELFAPVSTALSNLAVDPCQLALPTGNASLTAICAAQLAAVGLPASRVGSIPAPIAGQINFTGGGNPNLGPEKAKTITLGGVLQPSFLPGFTASLDWYRVRVTGAVSSPTISDVLNGCFGQTSPTDSRCVAIRRNPLTGGLSGDPASTQGVIVQASNLGFLESEGYDLTVSYNRRFGDVLANLSFTGNHTTKSRFQATPSSFIRECVGFYSASCDPALPRWSWNTRVGGRYEDFDLSVLWRHISSNEYERRTGANSTTPPVAGTVGSFGSTNPATIVGAYRKIPAYNTYDLNFAWNIDDALTFAVLVENFTDKKAPDVGNTAGSTGFNSGNTFPSIYDALGRRYTVTTRLRF